MTPMTPMAPTVGAPDATAFAPAPRARDRWWWCPPLIAVSVIGMLWIPAFLLYGFATMATDSCGPYNCPAGVTVPLECAPFLYLAGAALALLSFAFPWVLRWRTPRIVLAVAATALATSALPLLLTVFC
ncbi:hypothetical protein [Streptomyces sp. ISID311]|uniref:hypothetical protein n=1 Tax=Streptomyces sp. ISID311 TaxID=2601673 RepID=UPI0011BD39CB|nr:hypothetical protein [Streptomyces sp. ISID311]TXC94234.1 hypothetical protein FS847_28210 [Streptomyces sp. ISID311]